MRDRYDVIVVGARVGGSTLTALLGDAGVSVLRLDRARFPSTTCSTHFFRGAGMVGVLERLGVLDAVLELGCPPLTREFNYADGGTEPTEAPPQDPGEVGYCLSVRREPLDFLLLKRARAADSVDFAERTSAERTTACCGRSSTSFDFLFLFTRARRSPPLAPRGIPR
jgi:flavin-dependent dehydrogenase